MRKATCRTYEKIRQDDFDFQARKHSASSDRSWDGLTLLLHPPLAVAGSDRLVLEDACESEEYNPLVRYSFGSLIKGRGWSLILDVE
jgi:hypothetical protein